MRISLTLFSLLGFLLTACSSEHFVGQHDQGDVTRNAPTPILMSGTLSCLRAMRSGNVIDVLLENQRTKESIKLVDYGDDLIGLCQSNEGSVKILASGKMTSRFLFWGGNLSVNSFVVSRE